jgi:hypothetical protein
MALSNLDTIHLNTDKIRASIQIQNASYYGYGCFYPTNGLVKAGFWVFKDTAMSDVVKEMNQPITQTKSNATKSGDSK